MQVWKEALLGFYIERLSNRSKDEQEEEDDNGYFAYTHINQKGSFSYSFTVAAFTRIRTYSNH